MAWLVALVLGYLAGSIPFGLLLTKASGLGDIRAIGSGNIGATNVLRTGRKDLAALTLLLDGAKGTITALAGAHFSPELGVAAGFAAFIGHLFPVWLGFKGGKGVATFLGVLFGLAWPVALAACATWLLVAAIFRFSSLAALVAMVASPLFALFLTSREIAVLALVMALLSVVKHHENIRRLLSGQEPKIGRKKG
jgi:glycerol-3-phosphate acyltransferase PlsY